MFGFLSLITGLAPSLFSLGNKIVDLQAQKAQAKSNAELKQIDQEIEEAHDRRDVLVAEAGNRLATALNVVIRTLLAFSTVVLLSKIFIWDKVIGSLAGCSNINIPSCNIYVTDALDPNLWHVVIATIAFYFLYDITARIKND